MRTWCAILLILLLLAGCAAPRGSTGNDSTLAAATSSRSAQMAVEVVALNNLGAGERDGLEIEIDRLIIGRKQALADRGFAFLNDAPFRETPIVGQLLFKIANHTDQPRSVFPDRGTLEINGERIDLAAFADPAIRFGQAISGELAPGHRANGGLWFGLTQSALSDVRQITLTVPAAADGGDFRFELDLSDHRYDPVPENRH